ncbi:YbaY family lipoprotein [Povalibacter sp.]|uniref:YbaY family lipoprotein n=1 Tax=Povalibacter sp. TaxID=1962978 RepID=UPI002F3F7820
MTLSALVFMCAGCTSGGGATPPQASLSGTAIYRERIALPPDAVFEVTLEDVSRADAPSEVIGSSRIESPGNPPIRFSIAYDPRRLVAQHRYVVRAWIAHADALMFTTDTAYPVLVPGTPDSPELLLKRQAASATPAGVEDMEWQLVRLGTTPAVIDSPQSAPRLTLQASDKRVTGSGGCNRFTGSYTLEGQRLKFGPIAVTMMACVKGMEQERAFHQALNQVTAWRMNGEMLELLNAGNVPVLTLEQKR